MSELSELYQQVILDHNKKPRNFHKLETANRSAEGYNPLCGDQLHIYLEVEGEQVKDISFEGTGCAIFKAAASMMTQAVKGKTKGESEALFQEFHRLVTGEMDEDSPDNNLGKLNIFAGVREFPVRVKCATFPGTPCGRPSKGKRRRRPNVSHSPISARSSRPNQISPSQTNRKMPRGLVAAYSCRLGVLSLVQGRPRMAPRTAPMPLPLFWVR